MKRVDPPQDGEHEVVQKPPKRTKVAKACATCRQQKTRCDPAVDPVDRPLRCKRCAHFKIDCSFETSPPNKPAHLPHVDNAVHNGPVPWSTAPSPNQLSHHHGWPGSPSSSSRLHQAGYSPSGRSSAPSIRMDSHGESHPVTPGDSQTAVSVSPQRPYELPVFPVAPPSPPRCIEHIHQDTKSSMEVFTVKPTWSVQGRPFMEPLSHEKRGAPGCRDNRVGPNMYMLGPISFVRGLIMPTASPNVLEPTVVDDLVSQGLISASDATVLSHIWRIRFAPWLPREQAFASEADSPTSSFLQAAQWSLAACHLSSTFIPTSPCADGLTPEEGIAALRSCLASYLDRSIVRAMMGLEMTLQSIRALLILAAWTGELPAHAVGEKPGAQAQSLHLRVSFDGELLIGTAVRIASKMHLELDVEIALVHKREQAKSKAPPAPLNAKTLDRARMMFSVCIADAQFNVGVGRRSSSRIPLEQAEEIFGSPSVLATQPGGGADARMVFQCSFLAIALRCMQLCCHEEPALVYGPEEWSVRLNNELKGLERLQQPLVTAVALSDPCEALPFTVVNIEAHFLRLKLYCGAFKAARSAWSHNRTTIVMSVVRAITGINLGIDEVDFEASKLSPDELLLNDAVTEWGRTAKEAAESLIVSTLALQRLPNVPANPGEDALAPLAYAPEQLICTTLFGPTFVVKVQLLGVAVYNRNSMRSDMSRSLVERVRDMFREASPPSADAASTTAKTQTDAPASTGEATDRAVDEPHKDARPDFSTTCIIPFPPITTPSVPSSTVVGRSGEVLTTLMKLWDNRKIEPGQAKTASPRRDPPSRRSDVPEPRPSSQYDSMTSPSDDEGLHMIASTLSSMRTMGAQQHVSTEPPSTPSQYREPSAPSKQGAPPVGNYAPSNGAHGEATLPDLSNPVDLANWDYADLLQGGAFDFDMTQFLDPNTMFGLVGDISHNISMS